MELIQQSVVFCVCGMTAYTEYKGSKIKNILTLPAIIIGIILSIIEGTIKYSLLGILVPFALFYPLWKRKAIGAGDVKLLMAIGSLLGINLLINYSVIIFSVAFLNVIVMIFMNKNLLESLKRVLVFNKNVLSNKPALLYEPLVENKKRTIKLGYSIFIGVVVSCFIFYVFKIELFFFGGML